MYFTFMNNFTNYFISYGSVIFEETQIFASRIGVCASDIVIKESNLKSDGMGCMSN